MEVVGHQPLFWHAFDLPPGDESASILAAYSTLWMLGRHSRIGAPIDTRVHPRAARPEAHHRRRNRSGSAPGPAWSAVPGPDHEPASAALGIALNNPLTEAGGHDLARGFKPDVPIRDIFPWAELVLQAALMGGVSLFLSGADADAETRYRSRRAEAAAFTWLKDQDQAKLDAEKKLLEERIKAIEAFQKTRLDWTAQIRTIAADTPETTVITVAHRRWRGRAPRQGEPGQAQEAARRQLRHPPGRRRGHARRDRQVPRDAPRRAVAPAPLPQYRSLGPAHGHRRQRLPAGGPVQRRLPPQDRAGQGRSRQVTTMPPAWRHPEAASTMSEKNSGSSLERLVLAQLRDPIRLRFALGLILLASWYLGFYSPMSDRMARTAALTESERKRAVTAQQIEGLRKQLAPFAERIPEHAGQNELVQYVMAHVRQSPVKLVDLKPTKTRDLGPFDDIGLRLQFDASVRGPRCLPGLGGDRPPPAPRRFPQGRADQGSGGAQCPARPAEPGGEGEGHRGREARAGGEGGGSAMTAARLLKLAPTLIVAAVMGYAAYSIDPRCRPSPRRRPPPPRPPAGRRAGSPRGAGPTEGPGRRQPEAGPKPLRRGRQAGPGGQARGRPRRGRGRPVDPYLAIVQGLTLNATFVQGKTQYASIDGRLYQRGQHLDGPGGGASNLVVAQVTPGEVTLEADHGRYRLGYPEGLVPPAGRPGAGRRAADGAIRGPAAEPPRLNPLPAGLARPAALRCHEQCLRQHQRTAPDPGTPGPAEPVRARQLEEFGELLAEVRPRAPSPRRS